MLERRINGQDGEWRVDVRQGQHHGERAVEQELERMLGQMRILQQRVENAVAAENRLPRVSANQVADPEGDDDQLVEKILTLSCAEREIVGKRITQHQGKQHDPGRNPHRSKQRLEVDADVQQLAVVLESPGVNDLLAGGHRPEAVTKHQRVWSQQKHPDPGERRYCNRGLVGAGEHQFLSGDSRTGTASACENSNSTSPCQPSWVEVLTAKTRPSLQSTCSSSVAP